MKISQSSSVIKKTPNKDMNIIQIQIINDDENLANKDVDGSINLN